MNPIRALVVKKDDELRVDCYQFEIHFENKTETKTLLINLTTEKAYFIDQVSELSNNYFSTTWVKELLDAFKNNHNSQNFQRFPPTTGCSVS